MGGTQLVPPAADVPLPAVGEPDAVEIFTQNKSILPARHKVVSDQHQELVSYRKDGRDLNHGFNLYFFTLME